MFGFLNTQNSALESLNLKEAETKYFHLQFTSELRVSLFSSSAWPDIGGTKSKGYNDPHFHLIAFAWAVLLQTVSKAKPPALLPPWWSPHVFRGWHTDTLYLQCGAHSFPLFHRAVGGWLDFWCQASRCGWLPSRLGLLFWWSVLLALQHGWSLHKGPSPFPMYLSRALHSATG